MFNPRKTTMVEREKALAGRAAKVPVAGRHAVLGTPLDSEFPGMEMALFAMGCFWGGEKGFWQSEEVCSGQTGHTEVVRVVFDPNKTSYHAMLEQFWEGHGQRRAAEESRDEYQKRLTAAGYGPITAEILPAPEYYFAEDYHQQYLAKNPFGYCGHGGTGVSCPVGAAAQP